ncbi:hypothetical protein CKA81_03525 [Pollutimonas thiosulfatoxidans]|uniref:Uncharacterized protein n=1 Tax=Pollutimonas thiosulfatoxidans TaxID=2028345 RepID=A0A410G9Q2_9BURK|nr:hypothetical protein CKA81_03525 [Pollutimonas thiosulfatoxidans]
MWVGIDHLFIVSLDMFVLLVVVDTLRAELKRGKIYFTDLVTNEKAYLQIRIPRISLGAREA